MGSIAVTLFVLGRRAADSAKMPPPQPMSKYRSFSPDAEGENELAVVPRQRWINVCRSGFMRWRRREGPWGSHQLEARALKCVTSVGSTEDLGGAEAEALGVL